MELTKRQKRQRILFEIKDLLAGTAFPFMLQLILSASVIMFAGYSGDLGVQITALVFGEAMLIAAYVLFGRQNGLTAYRKFAQNSKRRQLNVNDITVYYKTGEYAVWKGVVIAVISVLPYIIVEFIQCVAPNKGCEFLLQYAFGWAFYPFKLLGQIPSVNISEWLNFIWVIVLVGTHTAAYIWGCKREEKRQAAFGEENGKGKKRR